MNQPVKSEDLALLIVDDEHGFASVLAKRMTRRGIAVTCAHSGTQALRIVRTQDFHAALVDLKMEDMSGLELLKIFKKMLPDLPVIMLTGHGCEQAAKEGMALGAAQYLTKPCSLEEVIAQVRRAAGKEDS